jgi:hypothetical protein
MTNMKPIEIGENEIVLANFFTYFGIIQKFCSWFFPSQEKQSKIQRLQNRPIHWLQSWIEWFFFVETLNEKSIKDVWLKAKLAPSFIICLVFYNLIIRWAFVAPTMVGDLELHLTWSDGWLVWTIADFYCACNAIVFTTHHFYFIFLLWYNRHPKK